jgi:hypothetical protein
MMSKKHKRPLAILNHWESEYSIQNKKAELKAAGFVITTVIKDGPFIEIHGRKAKPKKSKAKKADE